MKKAISLFALISMVTLFIGAGISNAAAGDMKRGVGIRAGYSVNPDQFVIGGQAIWGALKGKIDFSPSLDFGFGDHVTATTFNFDGTLNLLTPPSSKMTFYVGGGPTLALYSPEVGDGDTEIGLTLLAGFKVAAGPKNFYNIVARFGFGDIPDFKILFGYMFGLGSKSK